MASAAPPPRFGAEPVLDTCEVSSSQCLLDCPSRQELREFASEVTEETAMEVDGTALEEMMGQYWPVFTVLQAAVILLLWLASVVRTRQFNARSGLDLFFAPPGQTLVVAHQDCEDRRWEAWRWLTYQFTHSGLSHMCSNLFILLLVGVPAESFQGGVRVAIVFNAGVVAAALLHFGSTPHSSMLGMSGGCFALIGMQCAELGMNWFQNRYRVVKLLVLAVMVGSMIFEADLGHMLHLSERFDHWGHFGGLGMGLILGVVLGRKVHEEWRKTTAQVFCFAVAVLSIMLCCIWMTRWPPQSVWDSDSWCWARLVQNQSYFGDAAWHCVRCVTDKCISRWTRLSSGDPRRTAWTYCEEVAGWDSKPW